MQVKDEKTLLLAKVIGTTLKQVREDHDKNLSINNVAHSFGFDVGNTSRIENGLIDVKVVTLWKLAEAYGLNFSELALLIEKNLPKNFRFFDENE